MKIKEIKKPLPGQNSPSIKIKTKATPVDSKAGLLAMWWEAKTPTQLAGELCGAAAYLKVAQPYRSKILATNVRMYCGLSVYNYAGSNTTRMDRTKVLPDDRPTFNMVQVGSDTLVSRLGQDEPAPKFLTDGADYKQRHLAQSLNQFVLGEFYQVDAYEKARKFLRDTIVMGSGALKVYPDWDTEKVAVDRVMVTDLFVDDNDSINGDPQSLVQLKLMDRDRILARFPKGKQVLSATESSVPDASDAALTLANQVMMVEGWRLPIGIKGEKSYVPGRHTIACMGGILEDEPWHKGFPFVFMNYSDPFLGFWGQGAATQIYGTQMALNRILYTIARAITLVGVPRVFQEQSSKISATHHNNEVGVIVKYSGTKPSYEVAPCNAPEMYTERDKLIQYGLQQLGVSSMQATAQKPTGLNSGEAIRSYDDIATDRQAELAKKYSNAFIDLAYLIVDCAVEIAEVTGHYQTVYPNKDGTKEIQLPQLKFLKDDPFVIKCFSESSLPKTPAGRMATVTEQVTSGMLSIKEGRRLLKFPDLEQNEKLQNASEERILQILDQIVDTGKFTPPDSFMDLSLATELVVQYYNLYMSANLEEAKAEKLRKFFRLTQVLIQAATPPAPPAAAGAPGGMPQPQVTPPPAQSGVTSQAA